MGWIFDTGYIFEKYKERNNVEDLKSQAFYRFIQRTYALHIATWACLIYAFGGFPYFVWGVVRLHLLTMFPGSYCLLNKYSKCFCSSTIKYVIMNTLNRACIHLWGVALMWGYHSTFLVNSACHIWGNQTWDTGDLSKNNWLVALVSFGEGWHNNHHAFEYSARHGLEWWQIDIGWYIIRFLEALGLATNVKLPSEAHKLKKSFTTLKKFK
ncbi:hypothetical protein LXL04_032067 [Taraxacum kok-saghyz]